MIYTKQANFPYPLLRNDSDDYLDAIFDMDVTLGENNDDYLITITNNISSLFVKQLLISGQARLILVIKSQDNQFYSQPYREISEFKVPKLKLSFSKKTTMQLMIQSMQKISYSNNQELNEFYNEYRGQIDVDAGLALGFSDVVVFDGNLKKPFDLFEKKLDTTLSSDISISLTDEVIVIQYRDEATMFSEFPRNRDITNPYLYIGLTRALMAFLIAHADKENIEDGVVISELNELELTPLERKLYDLMESKGIDQLDMSSIDKIVHLISDNMLKKFTERIGALQNNAN